MSKSLYKILAILWCIFIAVALLLPQQQMKQVPELIHQSRDWIDSGQRGSVLNADHLSHVALFLGCSFLISLAWANLWLGAVFSFWYGLVLEGLQEVVVSGRGLEGSDVLANSLGILMGLGLLLLGQLCFGKWKLKVLAE